VLGANLLLVVAAVAGHFVWPATSMALQLGFVLALSFVATSALVWLALRPVRALESIAERVSGGDYSARVSTSPLADRDMRRLSATLNRLLERVEADRARIQHLAGRSVRARDIEREHVAHELRDSMAQTLAAVAMQLAAARSNCSDPETQARVGEAATLLQQLTDEMRTVAETLYPGTLGSFGLENALEALIRRVARRSRVRVDFEGGMFRAALPAAAASAMYRVAEEALRNVEQHSNAGNARVVLQSNGSVTLSVEDDGRGMDMRMNDPVQAGLGLFSAKVVLALVGGELQISSAPGLGTRVVATVPAQTKPVSQ
jgi:two-component system sensor histidine kinase UhpB